MSFVWDETLSSSQRIVNRLDILAEHPLVEGGLLLVSHAVVPLIVRRAVVEVMVSLSRKVLEDDLPTSPGSLKKQGRPIGGGLGAEGDHSPVDLGIPFQYAPDQSVVPLDVSPQTVLPGPVGLQDHVQEVCGVEHRVQHAPHGNVLSALRSPSQGRELVPARAVRVLECVRVTRVEKSSHHPREMLLQFLRQFR